MGGKYIDEQPESQVEKKTATQILEDENLEEHITDSMRSSHKMYAEVDDDETPAIERRVEAHPVGSSTSSHHLKFDTDPELEAQVAAEREAYEEESANRAKAAKLEQKAAKSATRHSDVHQTSAADEKLYPDVQSKFNPDDEKYWRQQMSKKRPLPKQARIETVNDDILAKAIKKSLWAQLGSVIALCIGFVLQTTILPDFAHALACIAAVAAIGYAIFILYEGTIARKLKNILPEQRDGFLLATILPSIFLRYIIIILVARLISFDSADISSAVIQFFVLMVFSSKYYEYLGRYGIQYDIKMSFYTLILTAPAFVMNAGLNFSNILALMGGYVLLFKIALVAFVPDLLAGNLSNSRFKNH